MDFIITAIIGPNIIPIGPNIKEPAIVAIKVYNGLIPILSPIILGSNICLTKVATRYTMAKAMAKSELPLMKLIIVQGIIIIPLPSTGRTSTTAIMNPNNKGNGASIKTSPILNIIKVISIIIS